MRFFFGSADLYSFDSSTSAEKSSRLIQAATEVNKRILYEVDIFCNDAYFFFNNLGQYWPSPEENRFHSEADFLGKHIFVNLM